ncbi:MAG: 1-phosphofructokinase [Clostridiales Family XIII bacterium]|jgi:1-phosphofructokinase|nr:1-phosphofructokinase [Clostridiales Family XIII bacterium]
MIYTVSFNPSIDYIMFVDDLVQDKVNRTVRESYYPGGKGINVSIVSERLGIDSVALGYIAGFTGHTLLDMLESYKVQNDMIRLDNGNTRINVKVKSMKETDINGQGPNISKDAVEALYKKIDQIGDGDSIVLAGAIPSTMNDEIYETIMNRLHDKDVRIIVDAEKDLLLNVLKLNPWLIKPNNHELADMFGEEINSLDDIIRLAKKAQTLGARNVLVSMAGDGALLLTQTGDTYYSESPKGQVVNSVGAGDSMVAGFLTTYIKTSDYVESFKKGIAAGSATAFTEWLASPEDIEKLYNKLEIQKLHKKGG